MFSLPRGFGTPVDVPLATAAWEPPEAVERLAFRGGASLFLGAIFASENGSLLQSIYEEAGEAFDAVSAMAIPPWERAKLVESLEKHWREALLADCVPLGFDDDRHFVTIAGSRAGKGTSAIIPNLCLYPGSVICLDPKGENASITALRRGPGGKGCKGLEQEVYVLDPFGVAKVPDALRAGMNPLALLDPKAPTVVEDAAMVAESLIVTGNQKEPHWDESAREFIKGLILHLITKFEDTTLFTLRRFLTEGDRRGWRKRVASFADDEDGQEKRKAWIKENPSAFIYLLKTMRDNQTLPGIAGAAETLLDCGENERGSILSNARRNTAFLDTASPQFTDALEAKGRTFSPDIFKKAANGASLYLCLPAQNMGTHGRWLRLMIGLLLERAYRDPSPPACGKPILFLLEEFFALGHMAMIEKAAGYAAGFGVKLWAVLQDLQQLESLYPKTWQTFLANAGAVQVFGISDPTTTSYISKALGETELLRHVSNTTHNVQKGQSVPSFHQKASGLFNNKGGFSALGVVLASLPDAGSSDSESSSEAMSEVFQLGPLLRPDEITIQFSRESGAGLLLIKGRQPIWYLRMDFHSAPWFGGLYVSPEPRETIPFGMRTPAALTAIAKQFTELRKRMGSA
jgi:type IV secretion system protein VirD4